MAEAETRIVTAGPRERTVCVGGGTVLEVPEGWELLPPGDAALTRRVKAAGPSWVVQEKRGRRTFSRGIWAPGATIAAVRGELEVERASPAYARRRAADAARRAGKQADYVEDFRGAVLAFLNFAPKYADLARLLSDQVTQHATPVGSGTVARTQRIPLARRAESAVIAWLRHHTTAYDQMKIARVKGRRREVRRMLAEQSRRLLDQYRSGQGPDGPCPLQQAFAQLPPTSEGDF